MTRALPRYCVEAVIRSIRFRLMSAFDCSTAPEMTVPMPCSPGLPTTGRPEFTPVAYKFLPALIETGRVGEAGQADLSQIALGTVIEYAADFAVFADQVAGQLTGRETVLSRGRQRAACRREPGNLIEVHLKFQRRDRRHVRTRNRDRVARRRDELAFTVETNLARADGDLRTDLGIVVARVGEPAIHRFVRRPRFEHRGDAHGNGNTQRVVGHEVGHGALSASLLRRREVHVQLRRRRRSRGREFQTGEANLQLVVGARVT